ncbi:MAG: HEAT repeat domain-containing protein [Bradymonadaceae bacterium]
MPLNPQQIAQLVDELDHPDRLRREEVKEKLVDLGPEAVPVLGANLPLVTTEVRRRLLDLFLGLEDRRIILPLMRMVYDLRHQIGEADNRGLAMRVLTQLADPEAPDAGRLFAFARDMRHDDDRFVRAFVMELLGRLQRRQSIPFLREALHDRDEEVRRRASRALQSLESIEDDAPGDALPPSVLLEKIRQTRGVHRQFHLSELLRRDDAFELASALLRGDEDEVLMGMQALQKIDDSRGRTLAAEVLLRPLSNDEHRAIALHLLAKYYEDDASPEEIAVIGQSLRSHDRFVCLGALAATARAGDPGLVENVVDFIRSKDGVVSLAAAEALAQAASPSLAHLLPRVRDALGHLHQVQPKRRDDDQVRAEAFVLRAIIRLVGMGTDHGREVQRHAFESLARSADKRPIVITALELLQSTTPEALPEDARWEPVDALVLVGLLTSADERICRRAIELLKRGAPYDFPLLVPHLRALVGRNGIDLASDIVPLLAIARGDEARQMLEEIADADDPRARDGAADWLRAWRNEEPFIEARFEPSSDTDEGD